MPRRHEKAREREYHDFSWVSRVWKELRGKNGRKVRSGTKDRQRKSCTAANKEVVSSYREDAQW